MLYVLFLAHLLGDYLLQTGSIARWKARSIWGVIAHGAIVTLTTVICSALVAPHWWPYALLIGLTHTAIDLVRARFLHAKDTTWELTWYLLDQAAHLIVILLVVMWTGTHSWAELSGVAKWLADERMLVFAIGYMLLLNPTWVLLRFTVRGMWGPDAAPHLDTGEKYGPMVERVLIATCVLIGQFHLVPLVLVPRRLIPIRIQGRGVGVLVHSTGHWAETALSLVLAVVVGLVLRLIATAG